MKQEQYETLGVIKAGRLKIFDLDGFNLALTRFGDGEEVDLIVKSVGRQRTGKQNRFFYGPILKAFDELGWRKQEAKDMLCLRFIPQECRQLDGSVVLVPGHTSALSVEEFNDFIDECIQLAAENGSIVKDADQWRADQRRQLRQGAA